MAPRGRMGYGLWNLWLLLFKIYVTSSVGLKNTSQKWSKTAYNITKLSSNMNTLIMAISEGAGKGRPIILHLDPALPATAFVSAHDIILTLPQKPHVPPLHLVVFLTSPDHFLTHWPTTNPPPHHLLLLSLEPVSDIAELLMQPLLNSVHNLVLLTPFTSHSAPSLTHVYTLMPFCSSDPHNLGTWSPHNFPTWHSLFPDRFQTTCRPKFNIAAWNADPPYLYQSKEPNNQTMGVNLEILQVLATKLNFSYFMTNESEDCKWGAFENGRWVGLLGVLYHDNYQIVLNSFYLNEERNEYFDFSKEHYFLHTNVFLKNPNPLPAWMNIVRPFTATVWGILAASLLFSFCIIQLQLQYGMHRNQEFSLVRAIVNQSAPRVPTPTLLTTLWLLSCLVISTAFMTNLVGIFTKLAFPPRFTTLSQLLNSNIRLAATDYGSFASDALMTAEVPSVKPFIGRIDMYEDEAAVVDAMVDGSHGLVETDYYVKSKLPTTYKIRNFYGVKEPLLSGIQAMVFKKHTPWKYKFNNIIRTLMESGIIDFFLKVELRALGISNTDDEDSNNQDGAAGGSPLTTSHLQGLFWLLGISWALSIIVFIIEIIYNGY